MEAVWVAKQPHITQILAAALVAAFFSPRLPRGRTHISTEIHSAGTSRRFREELVRLLSEELLPAAVPGFRGVKVVDSHVKRFPGAEFPRARETTRKAGESGGLEVGALRFL